MDADLTVNIRMPKVVADITAPWLTSALSVQHPGVEVTDVRIERIIGGTAAKVFAGLTYGSGPRTGLPEKVIVKTGLQYHQNALEFTYASEARAYRFILPTLNVNAPACYFAGLHGKRVALILEDVSVKGVRFCGPADSLDYDQAASVLEAFAGMHAAWWNSPELTPGGRFDWVKSDGVAQYYSKTVLTESKWAQVRASARATKIPACLTDFDRWLASFWKLLEFRRRCAPCILHGDEHLANLYFEPSGRAGLVDWQCNVDSWAKSVTFFLISCLGLESRRQWEQPLLRHYLQSLAATGAAAPGFEEAWRAYRIELLWPLLTWMTVDSAYQSEEICSGYTVKATAAVLDHGSMELLAAEG